MTFTDEQVHTTIRECEKEKLSGEVKFEFKDGQIVAMWLTQKFEPSSLRKNRGDEDDCSDE